MANLLLQYPKGLTCREIAKQTQKTDRPRTSGNISTWVSKLALQTKGFRRENSRIIYNPRSGIHKLEPKDPGRLPADAYKGKSSRKEKPQEFDQQMAKLIAMRFKGESWDAIEKATGMTARQATRLWKRYELPDVAVVTKLQKESKILGALKKFGKHVLLSLLARETSVGEAELKKWANENRMIVKNGFLHEGKVIPWQQIPCEGAFTPDVAKALKRAGCDTLQKLATTPPITLTKKVSPSVAATALAEIPALIH